MLPPYTVAVKQAVLYTTLHYTNCTVHQALSFKQFYTNKKSDIKLSMEGYRVLILIQHFQHLFPVFGSMLSLYKHVDI